MLTLVNQSKNIIMLRGKMTEHKTAALILAAGWGTRLKSDIPKVLHSVAHRPLISWVLSTIDQFNPDKKVVVVRESMSMVKDFVDPCPVVYQTQGEGTGAAALAAREQLQGFNGTVFIMFGDTPFISPQTLQNLIEERCSDRKPSVVLVGFYPEDAGEYGRIVCAADGTVEKIVEYKDATPDQRHIPLCNSGVMAVDGQWLYKLLDQVDNNNAKGELYLTDIVHIARQEGLVCSHIEAHEDELMGINSRIDLANAEFEAQAKLRAAALAMGVTMIDPDTVYLSFDTKLGRDIVIGPHVVIKPGVSIGDNVTIESFSHLEGAEISDGATIGPFARLRPGAKIGINSKIGNFVEVKNSEFAEGAKASHLAYIGDSFVGKKSNIGAGTITCNYDGHKKSKTVIGEGVFIGSNSSLVAPVTIGDGAIVGAGSTVTKDVEPGALCVARMRQLEKKGWAEKFHTNSDKEKNVTKSNVSVIDSQKLHKTES
jgi:bifunctional UDP-N-acetylglucosamine pyrophosphorylase / glucosamine-1-phosphate N-acetyltransferase